MNRQRKKYTHEEDEAIFMAVRDSSTPLQSCFVTVAAKLGRSPKGVASRWYTALSNPESPHYMGTASILYERKLNLDNTEAEKVTEVKTSWWRKILNMLKLWKRNI